VVLGVLREAAAAVRTALDNLPDWGPAGTRPGQYKSDLAADAAALAVLERAGFGVLSEESGEHDRAACEITVVIDPLDGSTNASRGLPWFATSLCALDRDGPLAAIVVNQATGTSFEAERGKGARRDGSRLRPSPCIDLADAVVAISGLPRAGAPFGWKQFRALGAAALDLCAVAAGWVDAYVDCVGGAHGPWDYLGGLLVCREAGAVVADAWGQELVVLGHAERRTPVAAATPALLSAALTARRRWR